VRVLVGRSKGQFGRRRGGSSHLSIFAFEPGRDRHLLSLPLGDATHHLEHRTDLNGLRKLAVDLDRRSTPWPFPGREAGVATDIIQKRSHCTAMAETAMALGIRPKMDCSREKSRVRIASSG